MPASYKRLKDNLTSNRVSGSPVEYDEWIAVTGGYEAEVGLRAAATEMGIDLATARSIVQRGNNEGDLPITGTDPLVLRERLPVQVPRAGGGRRPARQSSATAPSPPSSSSNFCNSLQ